MQQGIKQKIMNDFNDNEAETVIRLLDEFDKKNKLSPKVTRCIVAIANGNLEKLNDTLTIAKFDWRDIVVAAEEFDYQYNFPFK